MGSHACKVYLWLILVKIQRSLSIQSYTIPQCLNHYSMIVLTNPVHKMVLDSLLWLIRCVPWRLRNTWRQVMTPNFQCMLIGRAESRLWIHCCEEWMCGIFYHATMRDIVRDPLTRPNVNFVKGIFNLCHINIHLPDLVSERLEAAQNIGVFLQESITFANLVGLFSFTMSLMDRQNASSFQITCNVVPYYIQCAWPTTL